MYMEDKEYISDFFMSGLIFIALMVDVLLLLTKK